MSLLEHGSIVDLAVVVVKKRELEARIRKKWKMGLSGVFMSESFDFSLYYRTMDRVYGFGVEIESFLSLSLWFSSSSC